MADLDDGALAAIRTLAQAAHDDEGPKVRLIRVSETVRTFLASVTTEVVLALVTEVEQLRARLAAAGDELNEADASVAAALGMTEHVPAD